MELSFNCTKVNEAVSAEKTVWQPHLSSVGVCETDAIAAKVAARTKDDPEVIKSVYAITASEIAKLLAQGLRVVIDGFCRIELEPRGKMDNEDSAWDPARNSIAAVVIPAAEIRNAANKLRPVNVLKPVTVQLLGVQDATTYEQNAVVKGHTGLCQGVGLAGRYQTHEDEGLFVIDADGAEKKLTITDCTQGTIDFTVPDDIEAGEYRIEVRSRTGEGLNRTLVRASINGFTIKAA